MIIFFKCGIRANLVDKLEGRNRLFFFFFNHCMRAHVLTHFSCVRLFCNLMDCNPPDSSFMGFSRQEYWSGLPCPPSGDLPEPEVKPESPVAPEL